MADTKIRERVKELLGNEVGANMAEYVIILGVIAFVAVAGFTFFGGAADSKMTDMGSGVGTLKGTF